MSIYPLVKELTELTDAFKAQAPATQDQADHFGDQVGDTIARLSPEAEYIGSSEAGTVLEYGLPTGETVRISETEVTVIVTKTFKASEIEAHEKASELYETGLAIHKLAAETAELDETMDKLETDITAFNNQYENKVDAE